MEVSKDRIKSNSAVGVEGKAASSTMQRRVLAVVMVIVAQLAPLGGRVNGVGLALGEQQVVTRVVSNVRIAAALSIAQHPRPDAL